MSISVHQFPCLNDNYCFLVRDECSGQVACIDPPDADAVRAQLVAKQWKLDFILNTHWHGDHTGGNAALAAETGAIIIAPDEVARRTGADRVVAPGDCVELGSTKFEVLDTAGHTSQHISYYDAVGGVVFVGDTLFAMGCGRIFEGTPAQMWESLKRLAQLPPATAVYCAHEYTNANCHFALSVDRSHDVFERCVRVSKARTRGEWTVPTTIGLELATNPFLRAPQLKPELEPVEAFAAIRAAKDAFVAR
jgi:hydroxyacylglutathione hydrolase